MDKCCKTCIHWQAPNKLRSVTNNYFDCNWIIGQLEPKLFEERNVFNFCFRVPFDPHDINYYHDNTGFGGLYSSALKLWSQISGIRIQRESKFKFIQTKYDYGKECKYYDKTNG